MQESKDSIESIYKLREELIILGLTGRTGAGCSTVASILSKKSIEDLDLRAYKTFDFNDADERKYSVIYRFMMEGEKWVPFYIIEASTIIFSFVAERTFGELFEFIEANCSKGLNCEIDTINSNVFETLIDSKGENNEYLRDSFEQKNQLIFPEMTELNRFIDEKEYESNELNIIEEKIKMYCVTLNEKKKTFRRILSNYSYVDKANGRTHDFYSFFMQTVGNNIRKSGNYLSDEVQPGNEIVVAVRINKLIKMIDYYEGKVAEEKGKDKKVRICIDALRNTFEIQYFRDKYRSFYAVAVNTEDRDRVQRLEMNFNKRQLQSLDNIEYPEEKTQFYKQNIQGCLEISDIYLYNPNVDDRKYYLLTEQLIKYIALMLHPGLIAPTHVERCMQLAFNAKFNSGCLSRKVGAVVTGKDFSVRSVGWNDVPKGQVPCNLRCVEDYCKNKDSETFSEFELTDSRFEKVLKCINKKVETKEVKDKMRGKTFQYCFKDVYTGMKGEKNQVHTRALHAEENAFLQIAKYGSAKIQGGKLFTTASPCELCSKKAYQLGIKEIYYIDPYPGISKSHILTFGKNNNPKMILFRGAVGDAYISLYSPRISYKDELELQTQIIVKEIASQVEE